MLLALLLAFGMSIQKVGGIFEHVELQIVNENFSIGCNLFQFRSQFDIKSVF